jgi:hypothetical protein
MTARYYRASFGLVASLSLLLAGCGSERAGVSADSAPPSSPVNGAQLAAVQKPPLAEDTSATLWSLIGIGQKKKNLDEELGPQTGRTVSPVLWQAALDTFQFAGNTSQDPNSGLLVTKWYSPPNQPDERLRVSVFVLSRALRSDSIAITVDRETRAAGGEWQKAPVAQDVVDGLEGAILTRAQQIHAQHYLTTLKN